MRTEPDFTTQSTASRPSHAQRAHAAAPGWADTWERMPALVRALGLGGLALAFGLLIGFYIVVAGAVHRAEAGRQQARLDIDQQAACSAFSQAEARDLCAVTVAAGVPPNNLTRAVYHPPALVPVRHQVVSRVY
jgi:hypothetical protein